MQIYSASIIRQQISSLLILCTLVKTSINALGVKYELILRLGKLFNSSFLMKLDRYNAVNNVPGGGDG